MTTLIGGLDEVGWGSLAGPIVSVATVFRAEDLAHMPKGVKDSKQCSELQRIGLYNPIHQLAWAVGIGHAWPWEIDQYGPGPALQLSYRRALEEIRKDCRPTLLYVDGNNEVVGWVGRQIVEPKADSKYPSVSAASIVAKVFRDRMMVEYAKERQRTGKNDYGWEQNKGYGSPEHERQIRKYGLMLNGEGGYLHRQCYCKKFWRDNG